MQVMFCNVLRQERAESVTWIAHLLQLFQIGGLTDACNKTAMRQHSSEQLFNDITSMCTTHYLMIIYAQHAGEHLQGGI